MYKCIVVEDEAIIRRNLCNRIDANIPNFEVIASCRNGQDALDFINKNTAIPDLVLTDIEMPVMDGISLVRELYYHFPKVKIIIVSAYNNFSYAQQAIRYGVCDYLLKPVSDDSLYESMLNIRLQLDENNQTSPGMLSQTRNFPEEKLHVDAFPDATLPGDTLPVDTLPASTLCETTLPKTAPLNVDAAAISQANASPQDICKLIQNYIKEHYKEDISLSDLSSLFHFSEAYIRKVFKNVNGLTPSQYLTQLRITKAKKILLSNPDINVGMVGEAVGYYDPYYFSRVFQKSTGFYPSEYRRQ